MLDFLNAADWNFAVEERPLNVDGIGEIEGYKALVRADTNTVLKVHPNTYKVVSHDDVVNAQYDAIKKANVSSDFDFNVTCLDDGRKLKVDVLFNDLTIEPQKGDFTKFRATAFNSYDGSWALQNQADGFRLICLNGMVSPALISRVWQRHTSNISVQSASEQIKRSLEVFMNQREIWASYSKQKVKRDAVEDFLKRTVTYVSTKSSDDVHNKKQLNTLLGQFDKEVSVLGSNKWALYNAMTNWSTHTQESSQPEVTSRWREKKVVEAMASKAWTLLAA